jgi:hypothetical protein
MRLSLGVTGLALGLTLGGCNDAPPTHTSQWYQDHLQAAEARLQDCDTRGLDDGDADCRNAQQGEVMAEMHGPSSFKASDI